MGAAKKVSELTVDEIARAESAGLKTDGMTRDRLLAQATAVYKDLSFADPSRLSELVLGLVLPADLNGARVYRSKDGSTIFVPLPKILWKPCGNGRCTCPVCRNAFVDAQAIDPNAAYPVPYWDTLAIAVKPKPENSDTVWIVHAPEYHRGVSR